jgi:hypothetical protein
MGVRKKDKAKEKPAKAKVAARDDQSCLLSSDDTGGQIKAHTLELCRVQGLMHTRHPQRLVHDQSQLHKEENDWA